MFKSDEQRKAVMAQMRARGNSEGSGPRTTSSRYSRLRKFGRKVGKYTKPIFKSKAFNVMARTKQRDQAYRMDDAYERALWGHRYQGGEAPVNYGFSNKRNAKAYRQNRKLARQTQIEYERRHKKQ